MEQLKTSSPRASLLVCALLTGCASHPVESPDARLQRQAAEDARQVHHDVQAAGKEARQALANAGRETKDIVAGAREGWREGAAKDGPIAGSIDINHAPASELTTLPGMHAPMARRIVSGRPYASPGELVARGLLTKNEYSRIEHRLTAK